MINYYLLTKPGLVAGNLLTVIAGFFLASKGEVNGWLLFSTIAGLALIMASGCVFNNYIDKKIDAKMKRTKDRVLVLGLISEKSALLFGIILGILGNILLFLCTNLLALFIADIGFVVYVLLYSLWKSRTIYGTAIGSIAGAIPPVVGYCAVSNRFDLGAAILFIMLVLWQMPHFFAIALNHLDDYLAAQIPLLPVKRGPWKTKIHMLLYIIAFIFSTLMLTFYNYTGYLFLILSLSVGLAWLGLCVKGFLIKESKIWGRDMFRLSLIVIMIICIGISLDYIG